MATQMPVQEGLVPPEDPAAGAPPPGDGFEAATPEEQAQYDKIVDKAYQAIYDKKAFPKILEAMETEDPKEGLAQIAAMVVGRVKDAAAEAGEQLDEVVLYHAGIEILESLADAATQAGIHEFTEQELEGATYRALDIYRDAQQKSGDINQEEQSAMLDQMIAADQEGRLKEVVPDLDEMPAPAEGEVPPEELPPQGAV